MTVPLMRPDRLRLYSPGNNTAPGAGNAVILSSQDGQNRAVIGRYLRPEPGRPRPVMAGPPRLDLDGLPATYHAGAVAGQGFGPRDGTDAIAYLSTLAVEVTVMRDGWMLRNLQGRVDKANKGAMLDVYVPPQAATSIPAGLEGATQVGQPRMYHVFTGEGVVLPYRLAAFEMRFQKTWSIPLGWLRWEPPTEGEEAAGGGTLGNRQPISEPQRWWTWLVASCADPLRLRQANAAAGSLSPGPLPRLEVASLGILPEAFPQNAWMDWYRANGLEPPADNRISDYVRTALDFMRVTYDRQTPMDPDVVAGGRRRKGMSLKALAIGMAIHTGTVDIGDVHALFATDPRNVRG